MIGELLQVDDKVVVTVLKDNREWGYNPCADGTIATVRGFGTITYGHIRNYGYRPGVYENRSWIVIELPTTEVISIYVGNLKLVDQEAYDTRLVAFREKQKTDWRSTSVRVADLPETEFWEGDIVTNDDLVAHLGNYAGSHGAVAGRFYIDNIKWDWMGQTRLDGSPMPFYDISPFPDGGLTTGTDEPLTLVERGNVWKYFHDEPMTFASLEDEAKFHQTMGLYTEVRNPVTKLFSFTKDEALDALKTGLGHGITVGSFLGSTPTTSVIHLNDEVLGAKIAALTLKGFGL